jgi:beta-lactamase class A
MSRVVVLGAGVSGHTAAAFARKWLGHGDEVVVVSPKPSYNWIPSNIWVGVGLMPPAKVTFPLAPVYERARIDFKQARAVEIHPEGRDGDSSPYVVVESTTAAQDGHALGHDRQVGRPEHRGHAARCRRAHPHGGEEQLDRRIALAAADLVTHSPVTEKHVGPQGMTLAELCEAALTVSDNTAANALLASFGGPLALTSYARSLGDTVTRFDRAEPGLNEATPGDPRDTTTPAAMLGNLHRLVLGDALAPGSRARLTSWLVADTTGNARIRAGLPKAWRVGDKTGGGNHAVANDVAVAWPPGRAPLLLSVYYAESSASVDQRNAVIAEAARIVAA